jgi:1,2-phenylacetyl-CoA epoxidase PaaB subunit
MAKRLIHTETHTTGLGIVHTAKVYRDSEWNEWQVVFARDRNTNYKASYHAGDKADAIDTAKYHIHRMSKQFA